MSSCFSPLLGEKIVDGPDHLVLLGQLHSIEQGKGQFSSLKIFSHF